MFNQTLEYFHENPTLGRFSIKVEGFFLTMRQKYVPLDANITFLNLWNIMFLMKMIVILIFVVIIITIIIIIRNFVLNRFTSIQDLGNNTGIILDL